MKVSRLFLKRFLFKVNNKNQITPVLDYLGNITDVAEEVRKCVYVLKQVNISLGNNVRHMLGNY